ncbi:prepilin-type N-terminal cleavage/methylation domain-containing protein [bacterium]|nr:prepilin-type N-terminal cleavage/methylation domain-containing protein [bacterium]
MNPPDMPLESGQKRGFTLIELLIVIAIILILIAIALPNFLEAQVRAKVTRANAELRTVATAMESYRADNTRYCYPTQRGMQFPITLPRKKEMELFQKKNHPGYGSVPDELTTPVPYLPKTLEDFFKTTSFGVTQDGDLDLPYGHPWKRYALGSRDGGALFLFEPALHTAQKRYDWKTRQWVSLSLGPDHIEDIMSPFNPMVEYSPTNGTVSRGDITKAGP